MKKSRGSAWVGAPATLRIVSETSDLRCEPGGTVGIIANPMSGRDVRRLAARASTSTPEIKRDQVARAVVGAAASGARRILLMREAFRISSAAVENLELDVEIDFLDIGSDLSAGDSQRAALAMREAGADLVIAFGGDGTQRAIAKAWPGVPLLPLSTGTNNVFPFSLEATAAGAAAGLVASGRVASHELLRPVKCVEVAIDGEALDLALIDAAFVVDDVIGNLMPFEPHQLRTLVLSRAEPASVGMSPIGGLLLPCTASDPFGVVVDCVKEGGKGVRHLQVPISPGLYRPVHIAGIRRVEPGEWVEVTGPGLLAFDGDRERVLAPGQKARLRVEFSGPRVLDVEQALAQAAESEAFVGVRRFRDGFSGRTGGVGCC